MCEESQTFRSADHFLSTENPTMGVLISPGGAHGFLTLAPNAILLYIMSTHYDSRLERDIRWNDPALSISWDMEPKVVSDRDQSHSVL